jgi:hypothetical protein
MSGYFDFYAEQLRNNPGAILEVEEEVWSDILRTVNKSGFPEEYRQAAFKIRELYMYKSTTKDDFIQIQKEGYARDGKSVFIEKMHDLFHEVRHFATRNGLDEGVEWDHVTFKPIEEYLP